MPPCPGHLLSGMTRAGDFSEFFRYGRYGILDVRHGAAYYAANTKTKPGGEKRLSISMRKRRSSPDGGNQRSLPHFTHLPLYLEAHDVQSIARFLANDLPHFIHLSPLSPSPQERQRYAMLCAKDFPQMMHFSWFKPLPHELHSLALVPLIRFPPLPIVDRLDRSRPPRNPEPVSFPDLRTDFPQTVFLPSLSCS